MKRCPTCQKEFPDSMRFCQTDGTPLVEAAAPKPAAPPPPPPDPYKTVVGGSLKMDEDLLQIPEQQDPMKTVVSPVNIPKTDAPKSEPPPQPPKQPSSQPVSNVPPKPENKPFDAPPPPPKFNEPAQKPPSHGDSPFSAPSGNIPPPIQPKSEMPKSEPPPKPFTDAPKFEQPAPPKNESPFGSSSPFSGGKGGSSSPFDKPGSSPFDKPSPFDKNPPSKEPETIFGAPPPPPPAFNQSPFNQPPQSPFSQPNEPFNQPFKQDDWAPPAPPVAGWQDQGLGANTPFQPPVVGATSGQNQTMGIITLVLGILSLFCLGFLTGIPSFITGYMTLKNVRTNPTQYGGKVLAIIGMVLGALGTLWSVLYVAFILFAILSNGRF